MPKTGNKNTDNKAVPTLAEYIAAQIASKRAEALDKSRTRTLPAVPLVERELTPEEIKVRNALGYAKINQLESELIKTSDNKKVATIKKQIDKEFNNLKKTTTLCEGLSCIYTATDNYGPEYRVSGNKTFAANPSKYGFKKIPNDSIRPSDLVQVTHLGFPSHAMIFDSKDKKGKNLYNYSTGGYDEEAIRIKSYNPTNSYDTFRFVGTPADSTQWTNDYKRLYGNQMKCGGRRKAQLGLDIREGGIAIPIAPNMYYMNGRSHDEGGIGIGPNNKNGLEVEGGEVVKVGNKDIKVFSSVPLLRGVSPAQLVMGGANPNKVFAAQEDFKDRNRINDDGTRYKTGGIYIKPSKRGTFTAAAKKRGMGVQEFASKVLANKEDYSPAMIKKANFARNASRWKKELGGRIKAEIGTYQPKRNNKGQIVLNPNNPDDVRWLYEQQGKRGAKAVHKGQQEFLEGALNRITPIMLGVAAANPITTATSLAGGYLLGEVGELGGELYKGLTGKDYTREGKIIGQTIGGLGGPIGAKLFGKGAINAWNTYKSNRLNSTQTLIGVPETELTIRPKVRINRPKQLDVTNNKKYLPTDVEDLTWKEPKALLETQAQVTRRDLKNFNRWAKLFGYEPVPLRYAETKSIADRHVQDRIRQHNTFLRGVAKPNKLQKQAIEYELAKEGITNPTDYDVYTYMATHSAPTTGAGRADLRPIQVRKRKVGNFNLSKTSDSPIGALYTQGSGRGAAGYAGMGPESGGHRRTGVVVEVARPTNFRPEASYAEWVKENDFHFGNIKSKGFHKKVADRIVETGKAPEAYNLSDEYKQTIFNDVKKYLTNEETPSYDVISNALQYIKSTYPQHLRKVTQLEESAFNMLSNAEKKAYKEYLEEAMISPKIHTSFKIHIDKENNKFNDLYKREIISASKQHKNKYLTDIDYNSEDYTQPDYSVLKSTTRNRGNAQQHYIFRAPIGEKILEGRGFYLPTEEEIINATTNHYPLWTPGYSRNTRKFGGIKKFKFGGNMIYTVNSNVKNGLMGARPKAELGTIKRHGRIWKWNEEYGAYVPVKDSKEKESINVNKQTKSSISNNTKPNYTVNGAFDNARPQYYAEKRFPIAGSQSIAEKAGLARSGWSYFDNEPISLNYIPNINLSIPDNYGKGSAPRKGRDKAATYKAATKSTSVLQDTVNQITMDAWKASKTPKIDLSKVKMPTFDVSQLGSKERKTYKANTPKSRRRIGQYKSTNVGDWIGLGSNVAGSIASYLLTKRGIDKMPDPIKPVMAQAAKLKTRYNIDAPLSEISQGTQLLRALIRRNTQSSNTSLAREQRAMNEAQESRNRLYGQKENNETQLINQDRLNRQSVMRDNVRAYNYYFNRLTTTRQGQNQLRISNINNLLSGLTGSVNNILSTIESRRATNNTLRAIAAANPNVDARLIGGFDYYIDPITKRKYNKNQQYIGTING